MKSSRLQCFRVSAAVAMAIGLMSWMPAQAQESRWAAADETTAKSLIDYERQWAEAGCTHNGIQKTILAEDFYGTAPDGSRYSKKKELADAQSGVREEACTIYEVTVHFFGDAMAILYGSESAVHVEADGRKHTVKRHLDGHLAKTARRLADCGSSRYAQRNEVAVRIDYGKIGAPTARSCANFLV
jgi:hypothetical protein